MYTTCVGLRMYAVSTVSQYSTYIHTRIQRVKIEPHVLTHVCVCVCVCTRLCVCVQCVYVCVCVKNLYTSPALKEGDSLNFEGGYVFQSHVSFFLSLYVQAPTR